MATDDSNARQVVLAKLAQSREEMRQILDPPPGEPGVEGGPPPSNGQFPRSREPHLVQHATEIDDPAYLYRRTAQSGNEGWIGLCHARSKARQGIIRNKCPDLDTAFIISVKGNNTKRI